MSSNKDKQEHGQNLKKSIAGILEKSVTHQYIQSVEKDYYFGENNQFHIQSLVTVDAYTRWLLHASTSIRTDRVKTTEWNFYHAKQLLPNITRSIYVYPDKLQGKELKEAYKLRDNIKTPGYITAIDDVMSLEELAGCLENIKESTGKENANRGLRFEARIVNILQGDENRLLWNKKSHTSIGESFNTYQKILDKIGVSRESELLNIVSHRDIPLLPSGGSPKTDVYLGVNTSQGFYEATLSLKKSSRDKVTVHQYSYDKFVSALKIDDPKLENAFSKLQETGGPKAFKDKYPNAYDYFESNISKYNQQLCQWVFSGIGGETSNQIQTADYLLVYHLSNLDIQIVKIEDYIQEVLSDPQQRQQFDTPFTFTYASGQKGKSIQLKSKFN